MISKFLLLIDHDNITWTDISIELLITKWIGTAAAEHANLAQTIQLSIRAYGGWFAGETASESRFEAATFYQSTCPVVLKMGSTYVRTRFEFADTLLPIEGAEGAAVAIRNTYVTRASRQVLRRRRGVSLCGAQHCQLKRLKKWISRKTACTSEQCANQYSDYYFTEEQKQVDIHLAVDLLRAMQMEANRLHIGIASDDNDLLPAIAAAASNTRGHKVTHLRQELQRSYLDECLEKLGVQIVLLN